MISAEIWKKWFVGAKLEKFGKKVSYIFPTLYDCRPFYGDHSPHNISQRFAKVAGGNDIKERGSGDLPTFHPHRNIKRWGDYAMALVAANGGWEVFCTKALGEVTDLWPGDNRPREPLTGADMNSFIQRTASLGRDRYLQILAPPVAALWPLWFLKLLQEQGRMAADRQSPEFDLLRRLAEAGGEEDTFGLQNLVGRVVGRKHKPLYVDVLTVIGQMKGLPFPFGFAEGSLRQPPDSGSAWEPPLIAEVREHIRDALWSPPLLACGRVDQVEDPPPSPKLRKKENRPVRYMVLSRPCPVFATVYRTGPPQDKNTDSHVTKTMVFALAGSWGADVLSKLRDSEKGQSRPEKGQSRLDFLAATNAPTKHPSSLFLAYFPLDIFLRKKTHPLSRKEVYEMQFDGKRIPEEQADLLNYILPGGALFGGVTLAGQPRMFWLLRDLGRMLWQMELFFRALSPCQRDREKICDKNFKKLRDPIGEGGAEAVAELREMAVGQAKNMLRDHYRTEDGDFLELLVGFLKEIGKQMGEVILIGELAPTPDEQKKMVDEFNSAIEEWGWASLLEFVNYTSVDFSGELLFVEK